MTLHMRARPRTGLLDMTTAFAIEHADIYFLIIRPVPVLIALEHCHARPSTFAWIIRMCLSVGSIEKCERGGILSVDIRMSRYTTYHFHSTYTYLGNRSRW